MTICETFISKNTGKAISWLVGTAVALSGSSAAQSIRVAESTRTTFSVRDAINAEWYVDPVLSMPALARSGTYLIPPFVYSADGKRAVFLTRRGDVDAGVVDITLHVVSLEDKRDRQVVRDRELVTLSSTSNRPPISQVKWLSVDRIGFVGERPGEESQIMSVGAHGDLVQHSNSPGEKLGFDVSPSGIVVFGVPSDSATLGQQANGPSYVVGNETLSDIAGVKSVGWRRQTRYFVANKNSVTEIRGAVSLTSSYPPFISVSPTGRFVVLSTAPRRVPGPHRRCRPAASPRPSRPRRRRR